MDTTALKQIVEMMKERDEIIEAMDRLERMRNYSDTKQTRAKCYCVKFESDYTAHHHSSDQALNVLLVEQALSYYKHKLDTINLTLSVAEYAVRDKILKEEGLDGK